MTKTKPITDIPSNPYDRRAWVHFQLKIRGLSYAALARNAGVTREGLYATMFAPSARLEQILADAVEVPVDRLFPERFVNGKRIHKVMGSSTASHENLNEGAAGCTVDHSRVA